MKIFTTRRALRVLGWTALGGVMLAVDYLTGPHIQFPVLYLVPILLAAWYDGRWWGFSLAAVMSLVRLYYAGVAWVVPWTMTESIINAVIRLIVFSGFVFLVDRLAVQKRELEKEVRVLEGILPICSFCKKIRDQKGSWQPMERYISDRSEAEFSHGVCPECAKKHYPEYFRGPK